MKMIGALARTRPLLKPNKDVPLAMSKWWKKKRPAEGEITMHLSPHEQQPILPWIKTFPKKMVDRVPIYLWPFGTFGFIYGIMAFTDDWDHHEDLEHRF